MRRLLLSVMAGSLLTLSAAGATFAAGPDPAGNNPWDACPWNAGDPEGGTPSCIGHSDVAIAAQCDTNSGAPGHWLWNNRSWNVHCFAD